MLNIDYLKSGLSLKQYKFIVSPSIKDKQLKYYRLSCGFKDANNYYLNKIKI
jgi:hypothetical protein